ncbi:MAG: Coq4 family protein [Kovacikia sp.]
MAETDSELPPHLLKAVKGFIALANNPSHTEAVFDIADGLRHTDLYRHFIEYAHAQPQIVQILEERYFAPTPDLEALLRYPQNSLGYLYASTMKESQLDPAFYRKIQVEDDYSYIALRMRQTHDIWHLITGFGTDLGGELGLQAFTLAQTHSPLAVTILTASIFYTMTSSGSLNVVIDHLQKGWQIGTIAQPFLAQKWEEGWEKPVHEWRVELNVEAVNGE